MLIAPNFSQTEHSMLFEALTELNVGHISLTNADVNYLDIIVPTSLLKAYAQ